MNETTTLALKAAEGPLFRFALALAILGLMRVAILGTSDILAAFVSDSDPALFRRKFRKRIVWLLFPSVLINRVRPFRSGTMLAYHLLLDLLSVLFRALIVLLPVFQMAHVYLWERALAVSWPTLPGDVADTLSIVTIVSGLVLFLGRLYSPTLRSIEPPPSFFKPLLLLVPFLTGILSRHPTWSPIDYHAVLLMHMLSACVVLALLPFARLLTNVHTPLTDLVPEVAWRAGSDNGARLPMAAARS